VDRERKRGRANHHLHKTSRRTFLKAAALGASRAPSAVSAVRRVRSATQLTPAPQERQRSSVFPLLPTGPRKPSRPTCGRKTRGILGWGNERSGEGVSSQPTVANWRIRKRKDHRRVPPWSVPSPGGVERCPPNAFPKPRLAGLFGTWGAKAWAGRRAACLEGSGARAGTAGGVSERALRCRVGRSSGWPRDASPSRSAGSIRGRAKCDGVADAIPD